MRCESILAVGIGIQLGLRRTFGKLFGEKYPNDSQSKFVIQSVTPQSGGFQITWPSQPSIIYRVQWKNNLTDPTWQSIASDFTGTGSTMTWLDDGTQTNGLSLQRFYRITVP